MPKCFKASCLDQRHGCFAEIPFIIKFQAKYILEQIVYMPPASGVHLCRLI